MTRLSKIIVLVDIFFSKILIGIDDGSKVAATVAATFEPSSIPMRILEKKIWTRTMIFDSLVIFEYHTRILPWYYLSAYLLVCLPVSVCLFACLANYLPTCLPTYLLTYLHVYYLPTYLHTYLPTYTYLPLLYHYWTTYIP